MYLSISVHVTNKTMFSVKTLPTSPFDLAPIHVVRILEDGAAECTLLFRTTEDIDRLTEALARLKAGA